jgi:hypothetical protein
LILINFTHSILKIVIYFIFRTFDIMGLTKQYLRYAAANIFGIVAGTRANIKLIKFKGVSGKYAAVGACEYVFIWDLKTGENVSILNYFNGLQAIKSKQFFSK